MKSPSGRSLSAAALSGVLQVFSFPLAGPLPPWRTMFAWFSLLPLLWCILNNTGLSGRVSMKEGALLGYLSGTCFYLGNCYWIYSTMATYGGLTPVVSASILLGFCLYLGLYHALFGALLALLRRELGRWASLVLVPFLWVAIELARTRITGFPWDLLGLSQVDHPVLSSLAPLGGAYSLSFIVAAVNALWLARIPVRLVSPSLPSAIMIPLTILGSYEMTRRHLSSRENISTERAVLVQENLSVGVQGRAIQETIKDKLDAFVALSGTKGAGYLDGIPGLPTTHQVQSASRQDGRLRERTSLVVWPESPADFHTNDDQFLSSTTQLARSVAAPLILGSLGVVPDRSLQRGGRVYDSAALVSEDGTHVGRYDKIHLVPFGEYIPLKSMLFFVDRLTAGAGNMDRGTERSVFRAQSSGAAHTFGVFICYESIFGDEVRQFVLHGAEVLVNISDDGWYGDSGAAWQHLNMVRMRAIENHRWVLRATNTGITASIAPDGRVVAALPRKIRASIDAPFSYEQGTTFYTRHGDWFAYGCSAVVLAMVGLVGLRRVDLSNARRP